MSVRILGVDPGSNITGYGLVEGNGGRFHHVDNGCLHVKPLLSFEKRLLEIFIGIRDIIKKYRPEAMAIERVFFSKNVASSLKLGESRGAALLAAAQGDLPVFEYATREVKQALTGYGQASKNQIQKMVQTVLRLPEIAAEDASDALAIAICHLQTSSYRQKLMKAL